MRKLRVLTSQGDKMVAWEENKIAVGDPEAVAAVEEAERIFKEQMLKGGAAFKVETGKTAERIDRFDPEAEQIVIVPRIAGG
ncbi:MAG: hypothetical protein ACYC3S_05530 [Chloroflexota bacterium]